MSASSTTHRTSLSAHDLKALQDHHEFVRDDSADREQLNSSWKKRMARKFYNKLFKEYALVDLSLYHEGKLGVRWRTEVEVASGRGELSCGGLLCTSSPTSSGSLHSYEVPFQYKEGDEIKLELVKVRVCQECSEKLYHYKVREMKATSSNQPTGGDRSGGRDRGSRKKRRVELPPNKSDKASSER